LRIEKEEAMKIRPLDDRVLVKPVEEDEVTSGGIVLPDTAREKPQRGRIEAVGTGRLLDSGDRIPLGIKVGDTVLYGKYGGTEIKIEGEEFKILREDDILAVVES
jgi:chaperonin GroES